MSHSSKSHSSEAPTPAPVARAPVVVAGVWLEAKRDDAWVDKDGKVHVIVGVVSNGFDSRCGGVDENWRLPAAKEVIAAVSAWKRKD